MFVVLYVGDDGSVKCVLSEGRDLRNQLVRETNMVKG